MYKEVQGNLILFNIMTPVESFVKYQRGNPVLQFPRLMDFILNYNLVVSYPYFEIWKSAEVPVKCW